MTEPRVRLSPAVRASVSADGLVLLDVQGGLLLASNPIGAQVWQLLEAQHSRADIVGRLAADYNVSIERAESDVAAFIADLAAHGLLIEEPTC